MPTYLVERYLPRMTPERLATTALRAKAAAEQLSAKGTAIRYVHSTFLPQDEMCFCLFESGSARAVAEANEAVGLAYERITEAIHLNAEDLSRLTDAAAAPSATNHPMQGRPTQQAPSRPSVGGDSSKGGLPCRRSPSKD
jgi:hypothetical protein